MACASACLRRIPLICAFFGTSGRVDATHSAMILSDVLAALGEPVTLIRCRLEGEPALPPRAPADGSVAMCEQVFGTFEGCTVPTVDAIERASDAGRHVVLDMPGAWLRDPAVRKHVDVAVLAVGPAPLDEFAACQALTREAQDRADGSAGNGLAPPWLLGCGRGGGGTTGAAFARTMARLAAGTDPGMPVRALPVTLPPLTYAEASHLVGGDRAARTLAAGVQLLAALRAVSRDPLAASIDAGGLAAAIGVEAGTIRLMDERRIDERLRDLADGLGAIRDGHGPSTAELGESPRLDDWSVGTAPVRILTGRVYGHPNIPDGRRVTTSALYATDGVSFARTLSRTYALGRQADDTATPLH
jgi:hypothetical protein